MHSAVRILWLAIFAFVARAGSAGALPCEPAVLGLTSDPAADIDCYDVSASTLREVVSNLRSRGPSDQQGTGRDAIVQWTVRWRWPITGRGPNYAQTKISRSLTIRAPVLRYPELLHPDERREWQRYLGALADHEAQHLQHADDALEALHEVIKEASGTEPPPSAESINQKLKEIVRDTRQRDADFDAASDHGRDEGVRLSLTP